MRKDFYGNKGLIGYTVDQQFDDVTENVFDYLGRYLGYVNDSGTYDDTGKLVSFSRVPGLLLGKRIEEDEDN